MQNLWPPQSLAIPLTILIGRRGTHIDKRCRFVMLVVLFFLLLFCLLNLEELYHNQNLHSQIRRDVSRDQTSERKTRGKKRRYFEILVFTPAGTTRRASCVCVFERTGPFIKSAEPVRMILVIHWSGRMPYSLPWVTYWPYIVEMEWYAFFVCLLFINLVLKMAGRRDRLRSWGYPSFGSLSLFVCLAFAHIFFFLFLLPILSVVPRYWRSFFVIPTAWRKGWKGRSMITGEDTSRRRAPPARSRTSPTNS